MYDAYLRKWTRYARVQELGGLSFAPLAEGVNSLATPVRDKTSSSVGCAVRSALSCFLCHYEGVTFGNTDLVRWFIKGTFEQNPTFPKQLKETWDVNIALTVLNTRTPLDKATLTLKLVMVTALFSGQRCQTVHALDTAHVSLKDKKCTFFVKSVLKHTRRGALIKLQLNLLP